MPETIVHGMWRWQEVLYDLVEQGGLKEEDIDMDILSVRPHSCGGSYKRKAFAVSWMKNQLLLVTMENDDNDLKRLVEAFRKIVDYKPFCKYTSSEELATYEWAKEDSKDRYQKLLKNGTKDLTHLA